jgi:hypothetical protein
MSAPILRRAPIVSELALPGFFDISDRGDDVVRPAESSECKLDTASGGLSCFQEDEFVLVRDDHPAPRRRRIELRRSWFGGTLVSRASPRKIPEPGA